MLTNLFLFSTLDLSNTIKLPPKSEHLENLMVTRGNVITSKPVLGWKTANGPILGEKCLLQASFTHPHTYLYNTLFCGFKCLLTIYATPDKHKSNSSTFLLVTIMWFLNLVLVINFYIVDKCNMITVMHYFEGLYTTVIPP